MAERSARERYGFGMHGVGNPASYRIEIFYIFFAFDAKNHVLWVAKQKV